MNPFSIIFGAADIFTKLREYLKLLDSSEAALTRLTKMHQRAAKEALEHALRAIDNKAIHAQYVERATHKYLDSIGVEQGVGLFSAYVGLAFCNSIQADEANERANLRNAIAIYSTTQIHYRSAQQITELLDAYSGPDRVLMSIVTCGLANLANWAGRASDERQRDALHRDLRLMAPVAEAILDKYPALASR